jgi:hypothetical protein
VRVTSCSRLDRELDVHRHQTRVFVDARGVQVTWATVVEKNVLMHGIDEPSISINDSVTWWDEARGCGA